VSKTRAAVTINYDTRHDIAGPAVTGRGARPRHRGGQRRFVVTNVPGEDESSALMRSGITPLLAGSLRREGKRMQMFGHHKTVTRADRAKLADELAEIGMAVGVGESACCCPARPVVRVMMPASTTRPGPVDLLLCGHHYRASQAALRAAGAVVYDQKGTLIMDAAVQHRPRRHQAAVAA
jgi:hypothetical protein